MKDTHTNWGTVIVSGLMLAIAPCAWAQTDTATITGIVHDSSAAAVPGARVVARNVLTNIERATVTSGEGTYSIPLLNVGTYQISAEKEGFKSEVHSGIVLQVDQKARVDFTLQVGETHEIVTVASEARAIQTESTSLGSVINNKQTVELPLNSRSYYDLTMLTTNVAPPTGSLTAGTSSAFSVAGQNSQSNNFLLNGIDNNNHNVNSGGGFRPSIDAVQEFNIMTGIYSAEFGRMSGGQIAVTIKSGTNQLHASVYEFLRNSDLDSRNVFLRGPTPSLKRNLFGATAGGPIKRNKTFIFGAYEGLRLNQATATVTTVPTTAMVSGNFSGLPVIKDPITKIPFSNNTILPAQMSTVGAALAAYYPAPNLPNAAGALPSNNYSVAPPSFNNGDQFSIRGDQYFSIKDSFSLMANYFRNPNNTGGVIQPFGSINRNTAQQHGLTETHIFSPSLVNEFRMGFTRQTQGNTQGDHNIDFVKQYNIPNVFDPSYDPVCPASAGEHCNGGVPATTVNGYASLGGPTADPQQSHIYTYQEVDNLIWIKGSQTMHFGIDVRRGDTNWAQTNQGRGAFIFSAPSNSTTLPTSGNVFADLLLGYPSQVQRNPIAQNYYQRFWGLAPYFQDDWKITPRLTLNLGLRWEFDTPVTHLNDSVSNFDATTGKIFVPCHDGYSCQTWNMDWADLAPRVGIAWQPFGDSKTVIRAGSGFFYNEIGSVITFPMALNYPHRLQQTFNSSLAKPITLANPFPAIPSTSGPPPSDGSITLASVNPDFKTPVQQEWTFNIERQLTGSTVFEIGYMGSKGTHQYSQININQPHPQPAGTTTAQIQALRPYPAFNQIVYRQTGGNSNYESLEAKLEKRYSHGVTATVAYTWAKAIDEALPGIQATVGGENFPQDSYNFAGSMRGLSQLDLRHRIVGNVIAESPFGKGHKWLSDGVLGSILGGWQLANIVTVQSGRPLFISMGNTQISNTLSPADRPNVVAGCNPNDGPKTIGEWFDTSCFKTPPIGTFGNEGRNNVIGPGLFNIDTSLSRILMWRERYRLQIRAETFNTLNHPNWGAPVTTAGTQSFGTIGSALDPRNVQFGLKLSF